MLAYFRLMKITKELVINWLEKERRSRSWLAEKCQVSKQAVSNWLSENNPQGISASAQLIIQKLMEEDEAAAAAKPPHNLVIEFNDEEYQPIERAALRSGQSIREWAKDALNDIAGADVTSIYQRIKDQESQRLAVAEDPAQYDQTKD